jgi:small subunit ribosomal protein S4
VVSLREKPRQMIVIRHNLDTIDRLKPAWIEVGDGGFQVTINELPTRAQIDVPVREQLIVELYSK